MSVKIIIETLAERHLAQAAQLERECFSDPWSLEGLRADPDSFLTLERQNPACIQESGFLQLTNPNARFLAAVSGEAMAGYLGLHAVCGEGYIANLAVAPAFRRQGVARALLRAGAEIAEKEKLEFLSLEVRTSNLPARRLYESEGYVHIGARPGFYTNPREDGEIYTKRFGGSL